MVSGYLVLLLVIFWLREMMCYSMELSGGEELKVKSPETSAAVEVSVQSSRPGFPPPPLSQPPACQQTQENL